MTQNMRSERHDHLNSLNPSDYDNAMKVAIENADFLKQIEKLNNNNMALQKIRSNLAAQLDKQKRIVDDENGERGFLLGEYRNLEHEVDLALEQLEEEHQAKADSSRQLNKTFSGVSLWHQKRRPGSPRFTIEGLNYEAVALEGEKSTDK